MKNKFLVGMCRFHTKIKNRFLITGSFQQNEQGENRLEVYLDNRKLPFTTEDRDLSLSEVKSGPGFLITKEFFLWIDLPKDWRQGKTLKLINRESGDSKKCAALPVSKLIRHEKRLWKYVDQSHVTEDGFELSGWYIKDGDVKITLRDKNGKSYPVEMQYRQRPDVRKVFPECEEEEVVGFQASYTGPVPKQVQVRFESPQRAAGYTLTLVHSPIGVKWKTLNTGYGKIKAYYRQFGIRATVLRTVDKIRHRDSIEYETWLKRHTPSSTILKKQREHVFAYNPKISIVIPLYKTPENYLRKLIESVQNQSYENWELCLSDGSGTDSPLTAVLKEYGDRDQRIRVAYSGKQMQISENTNEALQIATGEYIAFADHDDLLAPNALYECVLELNKDKKIDIIYTDEDKIDMKGKTHFMPHFKPDFNIDFLQSTNYFCHLFVVKREIYEKVGMLRPEFDGAQDYDFVLRCVEQTENIKHIPKVLYHWRAHKDSTAENPESKNYAFTAGMRALQAHYDRLGIPAKVSETEIKGIYRTKYALSKTPLVSVIIPNKDHVEDLKKCLDSLDAKNTYQNVEYIVVENNSTEEATFAYYQEVQEKYPKVKVVYWKGEGFNYPSINNYGVECASGEYLLFLNNDTEIINPDCVEELLGVCMRKDVGAVGARLYYEDGTIQHAGVVIGLGGVAGHAFVGFDKDDPGYFGRACTMQNYSAVTAACMMVKRSVFEEVEGFDEKFAVAFNDIDFCLKVVKAGYRIVYNPYAELTHYESKSRGYEDTEEKMERFHSEMMLFRKRWKKFLKQGDPCYSPNLNLDKNDFSISPIKRDER